MEVMRRIECDATLPPRAWPPVAFCTATAAFLLGIGNPGRELATILADLEATR